VTGNAPPHPFGASVDAIMTGYADAPQDGDSGQGRAIGGIDATANPAEAAPGPGALGRFVKDLAIPTYGFNSGANWDSTQFGDHGPFFNLTDDAARVHDAHLNDREWVRNIASPAPDGVIPNGPAGIANFVLGAIPFWLRNEVNSEPDTSVTLTQ